MKTGVFLPLLDAATPRPKPVADVVRLAVLAEELGFDSVWVLDHLFVARDGERIGLPDPLQLLAAIAAATRHVRLGTLVLCGPFRLAVQLAREAMTLNESSGERFICGLGAGWNQPEFDAAGLPFDRLVSRLEAQVAEYRRLQSTPGLAPAGERPPLWIAGGGPRMLRLAARAADGWNHAWHGSDPAAWAAVAGRLRAALEAEGRERSSLVFSAGVSTVIASGDEAADYREQHPSGAHALGDAAAIAGVLRGYAAAGCDHAILSLATTPYADHDDAMLERAGEVLSLLP